MIYSNHYIRPKVFPSEKQHFFSYRYPFFLKIFNRDDKQNILENSIYQLRYGLDHVRVCETDLHNCIKVTDENPLNH